MKGYILGIDGGGSKTEIGIASPDGNILYSFKGGAINCNGENIENVTKTIKDILKKTESLKGPLAWCKSVCVGAAGTSNPSVSALIQEIFVQNGYTGVLKVVGDHQTAMAGAMGKNEGVLLISGTGSICYGRNVQGLEHRTGGLGHLIDDDGSGYDIGRNIFRAVVRAHDGRGSETILTELVFNFLNVSSVQEIVSFIYDANRNKRDIAAAAKLLPEAYEANDAIALEIVEQCSAALSNLVTPVVDKLGLMRDKLAFSGSILQKDLLIQKKVKEKLNKRHPGLQCISPLHDAAWGAVYLALESLR